ncbi:DUF4325 domain-containing protein [Limnobacter humi]|uniref:DUF4325 domain-containing protein n=1 Tax=Limnobacter humi TaxID=1778671 RepID=A0ABT1WDZ1_9BURK|nr:DUF4325 domain-containing protein [Limnobacter humi]MCQ8895735.1 DUF4325 domain-containing protein [Limnobacter humi]
MAIESRFAQIVHTVSQDVLDHPRDLTRFYAEKFSISRVAANKHVKKLEEEGWITRTGPSTHPVFIPGHKRSVSKLYSLQNLEEDLVWSRDFKPHLSLSSNVQAIVSHGFTEMLNNAIDHSVGQSVFVSAWQDDQTFRLVISDDGIGIFAKITEALKLPDMRQAIFELSKGKLTTDPSRHSGEGVFFTSRMFDSFSISANGLEYLHDAVLSNDWLHEFESGLLPGTTVHMGIQLASTRTTNDVYSKFTDAPEDYDFSKTIVPMRLAAYGDEALISRSQAKRLIARFDRFRTVILDFDGVDEVGQAFADELFRVYALGHPGVELLPENMTAQVERMYLRAVAPRQ